MTRKIKLPKKLPEATPWEEMVSKKPKTEEPTAAASDPEPVTNQTDKPKKSSKFLQRLKADRLKKGIILLPRKAENKIYRVKKALKGKGVSEEKIREELRKLRRAEELKFRKDMNKICLKCRERGHMVSECPTEAGSGAQAKICYKCGSEKHTSKRCHKKVEGFPYAKCFTCQQVGHLTKDCSQSSTGVYPNGGCCFICNKNTHRMADCPENRNKTTMEEGDSEDEVKVVASLYKPGMSMDEEFL